MHECTLCGKSFQSDCHLKRHKNRQTPCNAKKEPTECTICNQHFSWPSDLIRHLNTPKHKKNYNTQIANTINNNTTINNNNNINVTNHMYVTVIKGFSETNINVISLEDIEKLLYNEYKIHEAMQYFLKHPDDVMYENEFTIAIYKFFIKIFAKLNFNLAYSENHNCLIFSFNKSNNDVIEYQLLEIDNTNDSYYKRCILFEQFITEFLNLMKKINKKYPNEVLDYILNYSFKFKHKLFQQYNQAKGEIENELLTSYNEFEISKNRAKTEEEEFQIALNNARNNAFKHVTTEKMRIEYK